MKTFKRDNQDYIIMALNTVCDEFVWANIKLKPLKELVGSYKGEIERSYMLPLNESALMLAKAYSQESVLILHPLKNGKREADVRKLEGMDVLCSGDFVNVGHKQPKTDAWTYDIETGDYYVIQ